MANSDIKITPPRPAIYFLPLKRATDILLSIFVIVFILSWLIPVVYVVQKLSKKGNIFFLQKRTGLRNRTFTCIKFRTLDEEESMEPLSIKTAKMGSFGRFIRTSNIDELPQFFNVLAGSMSVIGPRPHMLYHTNKYEKLIPSYSLRHSVKPGISGLAQVKGFRGEIEHSAEMRARVKADMIYIQKQSLCLDFYIFMQSIKVLSISFWEQLQFKGNKIS